MSSETRLLAFYAPKERDRTEHSLGVMNSVGIRNMSNFHSALSLLLVGELRFAMLVLCEECAVLVSIVDPTVRAGDPFSTASVWSEGPAGSSVVNALAGTGG